MTSFRHNPRLLVQAVTYVAESMGGGARADVKAVLGLLEDVLGRVVAEASSVGGGAR